MIVCLSLSLLPSLLPSLTPSLSLPHLTFLLLLLLLPTPPPYSSVPLCFLVFDFQLPLSVLLVLLAAAVRPFASPAVPPHTQLPQ